MVKDESNPMRENPKTAESKHERFIRLSQNRTSALRDRLNQLGNLANRRHYEFNQSEVDKMFTDIEDELLRTKGKFAKALKSKKRSGKASEAGNDQ